ncbi:MAG: Asp-tRNA(Asn)/Glu-tRNA(Gln) amidotransferase subunit GatB [Coriobacteriia bacterium]|nr:Asp-tRNA(Asn)/Glu-tRNA(Gln) amidotransferase subunit GatB [Coriobacteriia bacterium]
MSKDQLFAALENWEAVIGLEVHTELTSMDTKMFCGCPVAFGGEPNTRVCPVCLGLPGSLPVPNRQAIEATILCGLATNCEIARESQFHRKQYFYPDMPKNYQISQHDRPFCEHGSVDVAMEGDGAKERVDAGEASGLLLDGEGGYVTRIGITRIHLEEDTGKMTHVGGSEGRLGGATHSFVDFNRAGTPLIELVTEPDIRTPEEARRFAQKLRLLWLSLGISDCSMEEGSMRVDANVSVRKRGDTALGVKAEIKNMNSFKSLHDGLVYEIVRQVEVLESGEKVTQETRHWDAGAKRTSALRSKEEAHDYRYFPEPDMTPFEFSEEHIASIGERLPELPDAKRERFVSEYSLPTHDASVLTGDLKMADYFEAAVAASGGNNIRAISNMVLGDFSAHLNAEGISAAESKIGAGTLADLVGLVTDGSISGKQAKKVFATMAASGEDPAAIIEREGMRQVSDTAAIEQVVEWVLEGNPEEVKNYRGGKSGLLGFFVGQVMREMRGQANPAVVNEVLKRKLG